MANPQPTNAHLFVKAQVEGIRKLLPLLPVKEAVWLALAIRVDAEGRCYPSLDTISKDICGPSGIKRSCQRMVPKAISQLEADGRVKVEKRGGGRHKTNHYYVPYFTFGKDSQNSNSAIQFSENLFSELNNSDKESKNTEVFRQNTEVFRQKPCTLEGGQTRDKNKRYKQEIKLDNGQTINAKELWKFTLVKIKEYVTESNYTSWFENTEGCGFLNNTFYVGTVSINVCETLERKFRVLIEKVLAEITGGKSLKLGTILLRTPAE